MYSYMVQPSIRPFLILPAWANGKTMCMCVQMYAWYVCSYVCGSVSLSVCTLKGRCAYNICVCTCMYVCMYVPMPGHLSEGK